MVIRVVEKLVNYLTPSVTFTSELPKVEKNKRAYLNIFIILRLFLFSICFLRRNVVYLLSNENYSFSIDSLVELLRFAATNLIIFVLNMNGFFEISRFLLCASLILNPLISSFYITAVLNNLGVLWVISAVYNFYFF